MTKFVFAAAAALLLALNVPTTAVAMGSDNETPMAAPSNDDIYRKAVAAVKEEQFRTAIGLLNAVIEEKPAHADALNYLGYSHRKIGDYAKAVTYYQRALSLEPDHRGAHEYLGQAYVELGNLNGAVQHLTALEKICGMDCKEYESLKAAIDAARARNAKQG